MELARAKPVEIGAGLARPDDAAAAVLDFAQVFVSATVDAGAERARLDKELAEQRAYLHRIEARLRNEQYLERAPKEVVDGDRKRREDVLVRIEKLGENLNALG
jgi:valyl-tRNA synthetase